MYLGKNFTHSFFYKFIFSNKIFSLVFILVFTCIKNRKREFAMIVLV